MFGLLLAVGICLSPPLFDMTGPVCADGTIECGCSECLTWDASPDATRYEVVRETMSSGVVHPVGTIFTKLNEDGTTSLATVWCFAWDSSFPHDGTLYRYQVRACNSLGCGPLPDGLLYRGAPYTCFVDGREVACYVGDALVTR